MKNIKLKKYSILSDILRYSFVIVFGFILIANIAIGADGSNSNYPDGENSNISDGANANIISTKIENPFGGDKLDTIPKFIEAVVTVVLTVGIPIIALAIIYVGFLFVAAQGNPEKITKAKSALVYTLIGAALLLGAFVIAKAIQATVDELKN